MEQLVPLPVPGLRLFERGWLEGPAVVQAGDGEHGVAAVDAELDVGGGHVVEAYSAETGVGSAACDGEERFAGED